MLISVPYARFFSHHCCRDEDITESLAEIIDALVGVKITASKNYPTFVLSLEFINEIILSPVATSCFHICLEQRCPTFFMRVATNVATEVSLSPHL
jgi:hypothetical protein